MVSANDNVSSKAVLSELFQGVNHGKHFSASDAPISFLLAVRSRSVADWFFFPV
jgi:hypothetical protein